MKRRFADTKLERYFIFSCIDNPESIKKMMFIDPVVFSDKTFRFVWKYLKENVESPTETSKIGILRALKSQNLAHDSPLVLDDVQGFLKDSEKYPAPLTGHNLEKAGEVLCDLSDSSEVYNILSAARLKIHSSMDNERLLSVLEYVKDKSSFLFQNPEDGSFKELAFNTMRSFSFSGWKDSGFPTGFKKLDDMIHGLQKGSLIVVAGRPGMGKTAFALNVFNNVFSFTAESENKGAVVFFSLEMSAKQLMTRLFGLMAEIPLKNLIDCTLSEEDRSEIYRAFKILEKRAGMFIFDQNRFSCVEKMINKMRALKANHNLQCVFVDYLQLMGSPGKGNGSRVYEIGDITRALKCAAMELGIPIVLMSQLSRNVEERPVKTPRLCDLRDSGTIEQDADIVLMLYREAYYMHMNRPEALDKQYDSWLKRYNLIKKKVELIVAKNRQGESGKEVLKFKDSILSFSD